jgi:hypothetical protein
MKISNVQELEYAILELENKKLVQQKEMAAEFKATVESLKPINLIKSSLHKINTNHLAKTVLKTAGGIGVALLTSKLTGGTLKPSGPKSVVSGLIKSSLGAAVLGNTDKIKAYGTAIFKNFFGHKKKTLH